MGKNVTLVQFDATALLGFRVDCSFRIRISDADIGHIHINSLEDESLFVEWVELLPTYRGKGYLRKVFLTVMDHFERDILIFESSEEHMGMYKHIGAAIRDYDSCREMTELKLHRDSLETK